VIPPLLAQLIMKCLAKQAADRPQSADELLLVREPCTTPSGGIIADGDAARRGHMRVPQQ
jgi:hypothetical protein